jgi:hypothetical protein
LRRVILVEPQPEAVRKLQDCYSENSCVEIVEAAVDRQSAERSLYIIDMPGAPAWSGERPHP